MRPWATSVCDLCDNLNIKEKWKLINRLEILTNNNENRLTGFCQRRKRKEVRHFRVKNLFLKFISESKIYFWSSGKFPCQNCISEVLGFWILLHVFPWFNRRSRRRPRSHPCWTWAFSCSWSSGPFCNTSTTKSSSLQLIGRGRGLLSDMGRREQYELEFCDPHGSCGGSLSQSVVFGWVGICVSVSVFVCVFVCTWVCICICFRVLVFVCVFAFFWGGSDIYIYIYIYLSIYIYTYL